MLSMWVSELHQRPYCDPHILNIVLQMVVQALEKLTLFIW